MTGVGSRAAAALRALAVTVTTVSLAAGGHVLAGGDPPAPRLLLGLGAVGVVAALPVARARLRARTLLPWALGTQVVIHLALSWLVSTHATTVIAGLHHGTQVATAIGRHAMTPSTSMLLGHLAATVLTVVLLVGVDRGAAQIGALWRRLVVLTGGFCWSQASRDAAAPSARTRRAHGRRPGTDAPQRGPPLALVA